MKEPREKHKKLQIYKPAGTSINLCFTIIVIMIIGYLKNSYILILHHFIFNTVNGQIYHFAMFKGENFASTM